MNPQKKNILFILPELTGPGGMEIENLGFISTIQNHPNLEVSVLNFYRNPKFFGILGFIPLHLTFLEMVKLFFSMRFLKIFLKSKCKLNQSLANLSLNFPEVLEGFLAKAVASSALCFAGIRPGKLLHLVHDLAVRQRKPFVYHEISKFNNKHHLFFQKLDAYGTFLISGIEKKEDLKQSFPHARVLEINQWLYENEEVFLQIQEPDPKRMVFGTISRLDFGKNFEVIFEALAILKKQGKKLKYLLFGDGPELLQLKQLATSLEIDSIIDFRGAIKFEERSFVYSKFDVFLMCSVVEGGPVTILEAMASGRPAISTNVGDVKNRIESGYNGFILDSPSDAVELAKKMNEYLNNLDLVIQHGKNSRTKFKKEFDQRKAKETFLKAIFHLIQNK